MSAAGFTPIQLYRTTTASAVPSAGNLADGELAINLTDEALYFKNASGVVTLLADSSGALGSVTSVNASGGTTGLTFSGGPITSSGTLTLGGTLAVANGGTGVTTSTGTGSVVLSNSPTLVTPTLGVASATSIATGKGTVGSVAYGFTANTNTGMWSPAADTLAFSTAGSERVRVTSAGNVGIGTSSPGSRLTVSDPGTGMAFTNAAGGNFNIGLLGGVADASAWVFNRANTPLIFGTNNTERMRIDSSGNVLVGTTSALVGASGRGNITVNGSGSSILSFGVAGANSGYIYSDANVLEVNAVGSRSLNFATNGSERMRITSAGELLVGKTGINLATVGIEARGTGILSSTRGGDTPFFLRRNTSDGAIASFNRDGSTVGTISVTTTATAYNTSSDYRLKDIDGPIQNSGAYIDALKPVQGSWKADGSRFIGLLAHEVQEVSETQIATGEKDGEEMQAMDYSAPEIIANLIAEIQSLRARVAQLEGN